MDIKITKIAKMFFLSRWLKKLPPYMRQHLFDDIIINLSPDEKYNHEYKSKYEHIIIILEWLWKLEHETSAKSLLEKILVYLPRRWLIRMDDFYENQLKLMSGAGILRYST